MPQSPAFEKKAGIGRVLMCNELVENDPSLAPSRRLSAILWLLPSAHFEHA
jgi:hypothetical protein